MGRIRDLTGQRFGKLVVLCRGENDSQNRCTWNCKCDCGKFLNAKSSNLIHGKTTSCGCNRIESLVGKKFGRLEVVSKEENIRSKSGKTHVIYMCRCDCGKLVTVKAENLRSGNTKSCGCLKEDARKENFTIHGMAHSRLYHVWQGMKQRCYDNNSDSYERYGGKGITVCDEWKEDFQAFYNWAMKTGYDENAKHGECTIDRINVNGNYEPSNCRWVTNKEQQRNKRNNNMVFYKGRGVPLSLVSEQENINRGTLACRLKRGMSIEDAISYKRKEIYIEFNGERKKLSEWGKMINVPYRKLYDRYRLGQSNEKILRELKDKINGRGG